MLVRNPASLGIENQRTKCVKMFRPNCIDFSPTTTMYYAYSTIKAPDKGEVGGSSPPRPTIRITPVNTRLFSLFSKNRFVNRLSTSRFAGWHYTQGVETLRVKPERLASIRLCRERCPVTSKDVEGSARHCKAEEGA